MKTKVKAKPSKALEPEIVEPTALSVKPTKMPKIRGRTPGERINFLHKLSLESGKLSIAAGIMAGWELTRARGCCDHGQWLTWLNHNTTISSDTATRYMSVYAATVGAARAALPEPVSVDVQPSAAELNEATANADAKSITGLYAQLKILKRNANHGGKRKGAGRKPEEEQDGEALAEALDEISTMETLLWTEIKGALDLIVKRDAEKDVFRRLSEEHLDEVSKTLSDLADKASQAFAARLQSIEISAREVSL